MLRLNWKFDLFTVCRGVVVGRFEATYHTCTWSETKNVPLPLCQMHFSLNAIIWLCIYHKWLDTVSQNASFALYPLLKENISFKSDAAALYQFIPCWLLPPRKENWKTTVLVAYLQHSITYCLWRISLLKHRSDAHVFFRRIECILLHITPNCCSPYCFKYCYEVCVW